MTIEVHQGNALTMHDDQPFWNDHQLAALRQLGVDRASNGDLAVFHHVCQRTGLDPFARQIYMIQRKGKQTIQTGIDGYRLVARRAVDRAGETLGYEDNLWCGADGKWVDVWLADEPPAAAKVVVLRDGKPFPGVALLREYVQYDKNGEVTQMWQTRAAGQLAKCAEALALRKAFPQDLSGVYTDDEMGQADRPTRQQADPVAPAPERMAAILGQEPADPEPDDEPLPIDVAPDPITPDQLKKLHTVLTKLEMERDDALPFYRSVVGHPVDTSKDLTKDEASAVIDALEDLEADK